MPKGIRLVKWCSQNFTERDMMDYECNYDECRTCGFNYHVMDFRKRQIEKYGLTRCEDGLYRYIIPERRRGRVSEK